MNGIFLHILNLTPFVILINSVLRSEFVEELRESFSAINLLIVSLWRHSNTGRTGSPVSLIA